jgi:hypothetical protein
MTPIVIDVGSQVGQQFERGCAFHAQADVAQNFEACPVDGLHLVGGDDLHRCIGIAERRKG